MSYSTAYDPLDRLHGLAKEVWEDFQTARINGTPFGKAALRKNRSVSAVMSAGSDITVPGMTDGMHLANGWDEQDGITSNTSAAEQTRTAIHNTQTVEDRKPATRRKRKAAAPTVVYEAQETTDESPTQSVGDGQITEDGHDGDTRRDSKRRLKPSPVRKDPRRRTRQKTVKSEETVTEEGKDETTKDSHDGTESSFGRVTPAEQRSHAPQMHKPIDMVESNDDRETKRSGIIKLRLRNVAALTSPKSEDPPPDRASEEVSIAAEPSGPCTRAARRGVPLPNSQVKKSDDASTVYLSDARPPAPVQISSPSGTRLSVSKARSSRKESSVPTTIRSSSLDVPSVEPPRFTERDLTPPPAKRVKRVTTDPIVQGKNENQENRSIKRLRNVSAPEFKSGTIKAIRGDTAAESVVKAPTLLRTVHSEDEQKDRLFGLPNIARTSHPNRIAYVSAAANNTTQMRRSPLNARVPTLPRSRKPRTGTGSWLGEIPDSQSSSSSLSDLESTPSLDYELTGAGYGAGRTFVTLPTSARGRAQDASAYSFSADPDGRADDTIHTIKTETKKRRRYGDTPENLVLVSQIQTGGTTLQRAEVEKAIAKDADPGAGAGHKGRLRRSTRARRPSRRLSVVSVGGRMVIDDGGETESDEEVKVFKKQAEQAAEDRRAT